MFDDFDDNEPNNEDFFNLTDIEESLQKFNKLETENSVFFSEDEIEALSYHFFLNSQHKEQLKIVDYGLYLYPNKVDFLIEKTSVLSMDSRYTEALECIILAKSFEPYNPIIHKMEGELLCDLDQSEDAEQCFLRAFEHIEFEEEEFVIDLYITYAQMLAQDNLTEKANKIIEKALKRYPDNEILFNQLAMNFISNNLFDNAVNYFKTHIDSHPYSYHGWYHLGRFYELTQQKALAIKAYEYSGLANKNSKNAFFSLGGIYESQKEYLKAIENYEECINNSIDLYPFICIARSYLGLENGEMARIFLKKAKDLEDILPEYHYLIGYSYLTDKQALKALPFFKKVYKLDKSDFSVIKGILTCYSELDRNKDIESMYLELKTKNKTLLVDNWKELASLLYVSEMDTHLEDLLLIIQSISDYEDDLKCVLNVINYDQAPSKKNKEPIISRLIHNFDDTIETVKLFCNDLYELDEEFKKLIIIYQKDTDE